MATLYITEYSIMGQVLGHAPMPQEPPVATQTIAIGGTHTESAVLNAKTRFIRIHTDAVCSVVVGTAPAAAATDARFATNQTEFRAVPEGGSMIVSVIANT